MYWLMAIFLTYCRYFSVASTLIGRGNWQNQFGEPHLPSRHWLRPPETTTTCRSSQKHAKRFLKEVANRGLNMQIYSASVYCQPACKRKGLVCTFSSFQSSLLSRRGNRPQPCRLNWCQLLPPTFLPLANESNLRIISSAPFNCHH